MQTAIVIPWREQPSRIAARDAVAAWFAENMPDAPIFWTDTADEPFNLSACRNAGLRAASGASVVVICDADTIPELKPLQDAIAACRETGLVHLPYDEYRSLRVDGTNQFLSGTPLRLCNYIGVGGAVSGVYVTTPETWWKHGGQDDHFRGWGFEDAAWYTAHTTLLGHEPVRHHGRVYAMHHESSAKEGPQYEANAARCYHYLQASGDVEAMRKLVFDGTP